MSQARWALCYDDNVMKAC